MKYLFSFLFLVFVTGTQAAEFFLKIERTGYFTVNCNDQTLITSNNVFRFFDLPAGNNSLTVTDNYSGTVVYSGNVDIPDGQRTVAVIGANTGLTVIARFAVQYENWYQEKPQQQTFVVNKPAVVTKPVEPQPTGPVVISEKEFKELKDYILGSSFDKDKEERIRSQIREKKFTSDQIAELCKAFSFDKYRLGVAKYCYDYVVDPQSYFKVSKTFTFSSYSKELDDYVRSKNK